MSPIAKKFVSPLNAPDLKDIKAVIEMFTEVANYRNYQLIEKLTWYNDDEDN